VVQAWFWHNICPALAPINHSSIYAELSYIPGTPQAQRIERQKDTALKGILEYLHLCQQHIKTQKILHLDHAYVIYDAWRQKNITALLTHLSDLNIHSIGRYGEWKYSSMQEAVLDGKQSADQLFAALTKKDQQVYPALRSQQPEIKKSGTINRSLEQESLKRSLRRVINGNVTTFL